MSSADFCCGGEPVVGCRVQQETGGDTHTWQPQKHVNTKRRMLKDDLTRWCAKRHQYQFFTTWPRQPVLPVHHVRRLCLPRGSRFLSRGEKGVGMVLCHHCMLGQRREKEESENGSASHFRVSQKMAPADYFGQFRWWNCRLGSGLLQAKGL